MFDANSKQMLLAFPLVYSDGTQISLSEIQNDSNSMQPIENCLLTGFDLDIDERMSTDFEFLLPGGINKHSTAANILKTYGNPNGCNGFQDGKNTNNVLNYLNNKDTGFDFWYSFAEDGKLTYFSVGID